MLFPMLFLAAALPVAGVGELQVREADYATLEFGGATVFNNVFNKGEIREARQQVFSGGGEAGWNWEWPETAGPAIKTYPEIMFGRSPWSALRGGDRLPTQLAKLRLTLDFDFTAEAAGSWCTSFDFWITSKAEPTSADITCNLNIWIQREKLTPSYTGKHEVVTLGGRKYEAIIETPADNPQKPWTTLCLVDSETRTGGSLDLGELTQFLIARGLARPEHYLATVELGSEVAFGKGRLIVRKFALR